jgi:hypothetical protein
MHSAAPRRTPDHEAQKSPSNHESFVSARSAERRNAAPYASLSVDLIGPQPLQVRVGENEGNGEAVVTPVVTTVQMASQDPELERLVAAWSALKPDARAVLLAALDAFRGGRAS